MRKVQHEKSATRKNIKCHSKIRKNCTRIVHNSAQTDNGPSVDGPLYTGLLSEKTGNMLGNDCSEQLLTLIVCSRCIYYKTYYKGKFKYRNLRK